MKKKSIFILAGLVILVLSILAGLNNNQSESIHIQNVLAAKNIYGFKIKERLQNKLQDSDFLIINFWASWCPPCIQEIPSLVHFIGAHPRFKVVAISQDDNLEDIKNMIKTFPDLKNIDFEIVFDQTKSLARDFKVNKLPETFIYQVKTQKIMQVSGSVDWMSPETKKQIDQFFNLN